MMMHDDPNRLVSPLSEQDQQERDSLRREWSCWVVAVLISAALIFGLHILMDARDGIPAGLAALGLCSSVAAGPIYWRRGSFGLKMPVASTLLTITSRMLLMMGALGLVTATKWSHRNSFAGSLLGCYFIFLTLESALSIRHFSSRTPS
jgi:hypothetical protein